MTNKEAIEEIKSMGLIIDAATSGTRRKSIYEALTLAIKALEERPQGEWSNESKDSLLCSACGKRVYKPFIGGFPTERTSHYYPNFCAFCGADMRKEAEND